MRVRLNAIFLAAMLVLWLCLPSFAQITQEAVLAKIGALTLQIDALQTELTRLRSALDAAAKTQAEKCAAPEKEKESK